ncbi:MAG: S8/S53 family peptidase [Thermoplasmatota archaeon]
MLPSVRVSWGLVSGALLLSSFLTPTPATSLPPAFVVVAVVDTGIDPYHAEFRAPDLTADPASYLAGYPSGATPISLSLDAPSYDAALNADAAKFRAVEAGRLYYFPGTRIIGAYRDPAESGDTPLLDDNGHGTATASLVAGASHGACPNCLLVIVEGFGGLEWAAQQPWIDIITNSWGTTGDVGVPTSGIGFENDWTQPAVERGQIVCFATGNGAEDMFLTPEATYASNTAGPGWVIDVGGYEKTPTGVGAIVGSGKPVTVLGPALNVPAAEYKTLDGSELFSGTSAASPYVAGVFGETLRELRAAAGDTRVGQRPHATVVDGPAFTMSRETLTDIVTHAASPTDSRSTALYPATTLSTGTTLDAASEGYGAVTAATTARAVTQGLSAGTPQPRPDVEPWMTLDAAVRDAIWGEWDHDGDGTPDPSPLGGGLVP